MSLRTHIPYLLALLLLVIPMAGCRVAAESSSNAPFAASPAITSTSLSALPTETMAPVPSVTTPPTDSPTNTPSLTPTSTPLVPPDLTGKYLLLGVTKFDEDLPKKEIWILESDTTEPEPLLQSDSYSYEEFSWSNDGKQVAFRKRRLDTVFGTQIFTIDITNNTINLLNPFEFHFPAITGWSFDDKWIIGIDRGRDGGMWVPFAIKSTTGEIMEFFDNERIYDSFLFIEISPISAEVTILAKPNNIAPSLWLVSLDGSHQEEIPLPWDIWKGCSDLYVHGWSPDGRFLLAQPTDELLLCSPSLWVYDFVEKMWQKIITPPDSRRPDFASWSPDGKWIAWLIRNEAFIYEANNWNLINHLSFDNGNLLVPLWIQDLSDHSFLFLAEYDLTVSPHDGRNLFGVIPNLAASDGIFLLRVPGDSEFLPDDYMVERWLWQP